MRSGVLCSDNCAAALPHKIIFCQFGVSIVCIDLDSKAKERNSRQEKRKREKVPDK